MRPEQAPRGPARRPRGRLSWPTRPPLLTTRPAAASDNGRTAHRRPRPSFPRKTRTPERRRPGHRARQRPSTVATWPPNSHPHPDVYSTVDDLAAIRPDATRPHPRTIRGLLGGACAGWRVRPTSVELNRALRADNPTSRQRSMATVLINEASFEELVNAHTEGAFTWRQLARAAARAPCRHGHADRRTCEQSFVRCCDSIRDELERLNPN